MNLTPIEAQTLLTIALAQRQGRPGENLKETRLPQDVFQSLADRGLIRMNDSIARLTLSGLIFVRNAQWSAYRE